MTHISPAPLLMWSIIAVLFESFLLFHLWSFDRFQCLRWNSSSGAFKRVMTYSYLVSIPLMSTYAVGLCVIKYRKGFIDIPPYGIIPVPYQLWSDTERSAFFPFTLLLSIGWSFEIVTHLEELCFWLFLVNSNTSNQNWFRSLYFKFWVVGSSASLIYMPVVTILSRVDPLTNETFTFLAGSIGDMILTLSFLSVIRRFPKFLQYLKAEGVDLKTMVRLTKFYELNNIRICFRFLFNVSILTIAVDGLTPHRHVNENMFGTDLLAMVAGISICISSAITLFIFFPRSIEGEIANREAVLERKRARTIARSESLALMRKRTPQSSVGYQVSPASGVVVLKPDSYSPLEGGGDPFASEVQDVETGQCSRQRPADVYMGRKKKTDDDWCTFPPIRPNRRNGANGIQLGGIDEDPSESRTLSPLSNVNPLVHTFTSPINLMDDEELPRTLK